MAVLGCSDDGGDTAPATTEETGGATTDPAPTTASPTTAPATTTPPTTGAPIETFATVPEDGVPGIDSDDPFCRAWSEFAGSFQALSLVASFGDPATAIRLEVLASGAVTAAVDTMAGELAGGGLPDEVTAEADEFLDGLIGPFTRRSERAAAELLAAGATEAQVAELGEAWLAELAEAGTDDPAIVVTVDDPALAGPLDGASESFGASVPPIPADPSLITDADATDTLAYIADTCPDQGTLAGNDVIDG